MGQVAWGCVDGAEARATLNQSNRVHQVANRGHHRARVGQVAWVVVRLGLIPTRATGSNWWFELESGTGVAAILSISRIASSNRELVITSPRLWLLFVLVVQ